MKLTEEANDLMPKPADVAYVLVDRLGEFERRRPNLRLINLETVITSSEAFGAKDFIR